MATLQSQDPKLETGNRLPVTENRRPKRPSGLYMMPLVGGPLCRRIQQAKGRKKIQSSEFPKIKGLRVFSAYAKKLMMQGGWNGSLPGVLARARLSAYYAKAIAEKCVELGIDGADESLIKLINHVSGCTKIGLYYMPQEMTNYEKFFGDPLPANLLTGIRGYPSLSLEFLRKFDDGTKEFKRAQSMMFYQNVAYDGVGSYNSPSYPMLKKGSNIPLEVQITKLVNTFAAVFAKRVKSDNDQDNPKHINFAAATMIAVSGKDVSPVLTAVLLTILYPPVSFEETKLLVDLLKHPNPKALEKKSGEDMKYAKKLIINLVFRGLDREKKKAEKAQKRKEEKRKRKEEQRIRKEEAKLPFADTFEMSFDQLASGSTNPETDSWGEDTIPEFDFCKKKAN